MNFPRIITCFITAIAFSLNVYAQKNYTEEADIAFANQEYYQAIELYKKASTKEKKKQTNAELTFKIAECYRLISDRKQAEEWYNKAIQSGYTEPIAILRLAEAKKSNGKYNEALIEFNKYKSLVPSDPRGESGAKSCELSQKWKDNPTRHAVENLTQINTEYSDFAPNYLDNKYQTIVFTSTRPGSTGEKADAITGHSFSDLYETKVDQKGKWSTPVALNTSVNSDFNEGSASINKKGTTIFFTRCLYEGCDIFLAERKGTAWGEARPLKLAADSIVVAHPSLSPDETKLYFASDMPGGSGGKDIWVITRDAKSTTWSSPVNLGSTINTAEDEMYPYIHEDGSLYFSSKGHIGMGGLDIFRAEKSGGGFTNVTNLKYPLNSAGDDFGIVLEAGARSSGYLSSNRDGGKGSDDLYSLSLPALLFSVSGVVKDVDTQEKINGATIKLVGSDGSSVEVKTDANGTYTFTENGPNRYINENTSYTLTATAPNYLTGRGTITTVGAEQATNFTKDFNLKSTKKGPIRLPDILYDVAKWDLKPQYQDSLNGLIQTLNDNPNIVIELGSHTDSRGDNKSNALLAQKRAQSVVDYLISKGIAADRLVAKGYGEDRPIITEQEIAKLKTKQEKEAAHQKNRRTDFRVIREDYVPKKGPAGAQNTTPNNQDGTGAQAGEKK